MSLHRRFSCTLKALGIRPDVRAAIALSGGPDSLALAVLASRWLQRERTAFYGKAARWTAMVIDHGLRAESLAEAETAVQQAEELGFRTVLLKAAWPDGHPQKGHVMEAARQRRYEMLELKCMELDIPCLMTAHHADDQAESGLIRLARASGIDGLQGILPSRPFLSAGLGTSKGRILRPLLAMHKDELIALCHRRGLPFAVDLTNSDTFFARNHLRELLGSQQILAASMPQRLRSDSPSKPDAPGSGCDYQAKEFHKSRTSPDLQKWHTISHDSGSRESDPSRALTRDVLRVMTACSTASQRLHKEAELLLERARLPGPSLLLDTEIFSQGNKHVAVRALAKALVVVSHPEMHAQTVSSMPHKAALQLWMAMRPGRQPRAFRRGGSIQCHVPTAPCPVVLASLVRGPKAAADCVARQKEVTHQALLLSGQHR